MIRRPKVECQVHKDSFELDITSDDDVQSIKQRVEAFHGLPADSHSLVWQGQRLSATKSLASYGVGVSPPPSTSRARKAVEILSVQCRERNRKRHVERPCWLMLDRCSF